MSQVSSAAIYTILINPEEEIRCAFPTYLFNQPFHLQQQPCHRFFTFYLYHISKKQAEARFTLFIEHHTGTSPCRGTFGSVEMNPHLLHEHLDYFILSIHQFAIEQKLASIYIKSYPFCYQSENSSNLTAILLRHGYQIMHTEINYHITITGHPFIAQIHVSEKRKLKKCLDRGFLFREELQPDLPLVYHMIQATRERGGFPVSLHYSDFEQLFVRFPGIYQVFTVKDADKIIALTVTVQINREILYYFYPADDSAYRTYSPMVLLMKGLYEYGQQHHFKLLDLGIATDRGEPNYGLMRFKQFLGGKSSPKLSFFKSFNSQKSY